MSGKTRQRALTLVIDTESGRARPGLSSSMGGSIATFDNWTIEGTVLYDELIVVLEGPFRLQLGGSENRAVEAGPGDVIWLPESTPLRYGGDGAKVFHALSPVDWKSHIISREAP